MSGQSKEEKEKLIIYGSYSSYIHGIQHFDNMQNTYRMLTSTILLASFAAIGFMQSLKTTIFPFEKAIGILVIGIIGVASLLTLWHLDLIFYERLLMCNFAEAYKLECKYSWLPRVHYNMIHGKSAKDRPGNAVYFYIGCMASLVLMTGMLLSFHAQKHSNILSIIFLILTFFTIGSIFIFLKMKTAKVRDLLNKLIKKK